jgi:hypothetical protein
MADSSGNRYERAFRNWLVDNRVKYTTIDQNKRAAFNKIKLKSFDFILYPSNQSTIIAEVKGRSFKGTSFEKLAGFECWVSTEDIDGLSQWQKVFGDGHRVFFIFAYNVVNIDVDFNGRSAYDYRDNRYAFFAVSLDDYKRFMKTRSPKWRTVTLPAERFRQCVVQLQNLLL